MTPPGRTARAPAIVGLGIVALGIVALGIVALTGCKPPDRGPRFRAVDPAHPRDGGTLRISIASPISTLDPARGYDEYSYLVFHALFDTLVGFSIGGLTLEPRLAERWEQSTNGLEYTFWLRAGIAFSDGVPITANDFKRSFERTLANHDSQLAQYLADINGAPAVIAGEADACAGIEVHGDRQLVIKLAQSNPAFLDILAMPFANPQRASAGDALRMPDASGPFQLGSWDEGTQLVLTRNPHYYAPATVHLDAIVLFENLPHDTEIQMFERGELDAATRLPSPDYLFFTNEPAWRPFLHRSVLMNVFGVRMNVTRKPFDDPRVRQALNYAVDKSHIDRLLNGTTVPAHGILPPGMLGRDGKLAPYPHDVTRARALLAEAGYPDGFDVEYVTPDDEETVKLAISLQSDLAEAGVRVRITLMSWPAWQVTVSRADGSAFSFTSWTADFPDPMNFFEPRFHSRAVRKANSSNDSFYANPALDEVLDHAHHELEAENRDALYHQAERILYADAPWIWGYHRLTVELTQPYVQGFDPHPIWLRDYTSAWLDVGADGKPVPR
jgi:ABC-type transport system substrate-binding protein